MTDDSRISTAYHEAGHTVMALRLGWPLLPAGVTIDADGEGGHTATAGPSGNPNIPPTGGPDEARQIALVALAGPLCEAKSQGQKHPIRDSVRRLDSVAQGRRWLADDPGPFDHSTDALQAAGVCILVAPHATDEQIAAVLERLERATWNTICRPDFRAAVAKVAFALYEAGHLKPAAVRNLVETEVMVQHQEISK